MARSRMVRPEFWDDEKLAMISRDARLTFIGLWNHSDDYGVVKGNPVWLKSKIYPYDEKLKIGLFKSWLIEIKEIKLILPFSSNGENYYFIKNFLKHQKVNRPSQQRNPSPPDTIIEDSLSDHGELMPKTETEFKQKQKQKQKKACEWPGDFCLTEKMKMYAIKHGIDPDKVDLFFEDFNNWAEQGAKKYVDWEAAFRNRVLKARELGKQFLKDGDRENVLGNLRAKYAGSGKVAQEGAD